jgi:hypothetical protein
MIASQFVMECPRGWIRVCTGGMGIRNESELGA